MFSLKKFTAFFVTAGIFCAFFVSPAFAEYATGYIPEPFDTTHLYNDPPRFPAKHTNNDRVGATPDTFPVSYDLRNYGRVPAVRNQNPYGTCWAHATLGALESNYLTRSKDLDALTSVDLSELHMSWYVYKDPGEGKAFPIGTATFGTGVLGQGGNATRSTAYITRLAGPVYESAMPYSAAGTNTSTADATMTALVGSKRADHPSYAPIALRLMERYDMGLVSKDNRDLVKQMIMEHGAMQISYNAGSGSTSPEGGTTAYFDNSKGTSTNHAVLIVGWNDNFASKDFNSDTSKCPKENGAWLVRNSWGADWPYTKNDADGYFWMSYEQYIAYGYVFIAGNYESGLKHYGYDDLGQTGHFTVKSDSSSSGRYAANVFKADGDEKIESAAFYTNENNMSCDVYVYDLGTDMPASPVSDTLLTSASGLYYPIAGYHTIKFDSTVPISAGHYFSVIVKFANNAGFTVPISYPNSVNTNVKLVQGVSYYASSLAGLTSARNDCNMCIKAFTLHNETATETPVNSTNFPDDNFRSYITSMFGSYLSEGEINATTSLAPNYLEISNLKGIELFTNLKELDISGNTLDKDQSNKFVFSGYSLVLSGKIGLDFYVKIADGVDSSDAYVVFTVNGKTESETPLAEGVKQTDGTYRFTCYINSVQMADDITAEIHYGENCTTAKYTVSKYLDGLNALIDSKYAEVSADLKTLANAIKDYGHYVQPILAQTNSWDLGTDHKIMPYSNAKISSDISTVKETLHEGYSMDRPATMEGFSGLQVDLELDTDTAINLYFTKADGVDESLPVYATVDSGESFSAEKQSDGTYLVSITGIPAHELGTQHTVTINVDGKEKFDVKVSALTYADLVLQSGSQPTKLQEAVIALYKYYTATAQYRKSAGLDN